MIALSIPEGIALSIPEGIALSIPEGTPRPSLRPVADGRGVIALHIPKGIALRRGFASRSVAASHPGRASRRGPWKGIALRILERIPEGTLEGHRAAHPGEDPEGGP